MLMFPSVFIRLAARNVSYMAMVGIGLHFCSNNCPSLDHIDRWVSKKACKEDSSWWRPCFDLIKVVTSEEQFRAEGKIYSSFCRARCWNGHTSLDGGSKYVQRMLLGCQAVAGRTSMKHCAGSTQLFYQRWRAPVGFVPVHGAGEGRSMGSRWRKEQPAFDKKHDALHQDPRCQAWMGGASSRPLGCIDDSHQRCMVGGEARLGRDQGGP